MKKTWENINRVREYGQLTRALEPLIFECYSFPFQPELDLVDSQFAVAKPHMTISGNIGFSESVRASKLTIAIIKPWCFI